MDGGFKCPGCGKVVVTSICPYCGEDTGYGRYIERIKNKEWDEIDEASYGEKISLKSASFGFFDIGFPLIFGGMFLTVGLIFFIVIISHIQISQAVHYSKSATAAYGFVEIMIIFMAIVCIGIGCLSFIPIFRNHHRYSMCKKFGKKYRGKVIGKTDDSRYRINGNPVIVYIIGFQYKGEQRFVEYNTKSVKDIYKAGESVIVKIYGDNYTILPGNRRV